MSSTALSRKIEAFQRNAATQPCRVSIHLNQADTANPNKLGQIATKAATLVAIVALSASTVFAVKQGFDKFNAYLDAKAQAESSAAEQRASQARQAESQRQAELERQYLNEQLSPKDQLRAQLDYVEVEYMGKKSTALDVPSRVTLAKAAAQEFELEKSGLTWKDLYGVIHAETAWISRDGMGLNGKVSRGLAQMEDATAKALGINDPNDPVDAAFGAAKLLKEAAAWSHSRIRNLGLTGQERKEALRDGISVYYNLSSKKRAEWDGTNNHEMPYATQRHIENVKDGVALAHRYEKALNDKNRQTQSLNQTRPQSLTSALPANSSLRQHASAIIAKHHEIQAQQSQVEYSVSESRRETMRG